MAIKDRRYNFSAITKLSKTVTSRMNDLYKQTYNSSRNTRRELEDISDRVEDNIDSIMNRNNQIDTPNIARLYSNIALNNMLKDKKTQRQIEHVFEDDTFTTTILGSYLENKGVRELKSEIDIVCKYMPKLDEALKALRDAVLSSDSSSKDFINAVASSNYDEDRVIFSTRLDTIKKKYKLSEKFDKYTYNTEKYGEEFVYHVPYKKAIAKLLKNKDRLGTVSNPGRLHEANITIPKDINVNSNIHYNNITLTMDFGGILESAVHENTILNESVSSINEIGSLNENFDVLLTEANNNIKGLDNKKNKDKYALNKTIDSDLEYPTYDKDETASDGLIKGTTYNQDKEINLKTPGCVLKSLSPENILLLYIDDICLGYYYFEFDPTTDANMIYNGQYDSSGYGLNQLNRIGSSNDDEIKNQRNKTELLKYVSSSIAREIDDRFINTNTDLAKEIYAILKFNDIYNSTYSNMNIRVTYIPDEDLTHIKFQEDPDTHRGISDIYGCLVAAKMWCCININDTIASLTRSQDRRVYYVKQNVETNIAQTMMNVINQIKRNNFNIRQIENMNSILNIIGKYNDFVIPLSPSGDAPVQMEVMQGQDIQPNTELLDRLEEQCINHTGVPLELINARYSTDFATQITMSNIKFLRHCILRQEKLEYFFSRILSVIYNAEYDENVYVKCTLPQPLFLNITNLNNILDTVKTNTETVAGFEYDDDQSEESQTKKAMFIKYMMRQKLNTYVKADEVEMIKTKVDFEYSKKKKQEDQAASGGY